MMFHVRRDARLRERWRIDFAALGREFGLSSSEIESVQAKDPRRLMDLCVHQYYVPQILRLFFGAAQNSNSSETLNCYKRAFPEETASALAHQAAPPSARS